MADVDLRLIMSLLGTSGILEGIKSVGSALGGAGGLAGGLATVGLAAGAVAVAIGVESVKAAADFQSETERLVTSAGELQSNLDLVRQGILKMSVDTATSTEQLSAGMYYVESAGYHASAGLQVLQAAAEGAKSENADLDIVTKALTTEMIDYHMKASDAAEAMNGLIAAVQNGKTNLQDLSSSMGNVLPIASSLGINFANVAGVMDTMTNAGMSARQASQNLAHVLLSLSAPSGVAVSSMKEVGLSAQGVKDALVNQGLPEALQMIETAVGKKFPEGSVAYEQALKNILGGIVGVKLAAQLTGDNLAMTEQNINKVAGAMKDGHGQVSGFAEIQGTLNFKLSQVGEALHAVFIVIGTQLLPIVSNVVGAVTPVINNFASWIQQGDNLKYVLIGVGTLILGLLLPAVWSLAAGVIAATWPFILIGAAIAGLVALFKHWYDTNSGFHSFIDGVVQSVKNLWQTIQTQILPALGQFWQTISTNIVPALQQMGQWIQAHILPFLQQFAQTFQSQIQPTLASLSDTLHNTLIPAWNSLKASLQPLLPILEFVGAVIGIVLVLALGILAGIINGVIAGLGPLVAGISQAFGGIAQVVSGAIQFVVGLVGGLIKVIGDLLGGHFDRIGQDFIDIWNNLKDGVVNIVLGLWHTILGLFQATVGTIWNVVGGFVSGVINFFQTLFDQVVGHSIIPDMINAVVSWFQRLPGWVFQQIMNFVNGVLARVRQLSQQFVNLVNALVHQGVALFLQLGTQVLHAVEQMAAWVMTHILGMKQGTVDRILAMVNAVIGIIVGWVANVIGNAKQMVDNFIAQIKRFLQDPIGTIKDMAGQILDTIGQLPGKLLQSGKDMLQNFIDGIQSMIPNLGNVLQNVGNTIANFLGFSLPKEGPLAQSDQWMPDFGDVLTSGLYDQINKIKTAASGVAGSIGINFSPAGGLGSVPATALGGGNVTHNHIFQPTITLPMLVPPQNSTQMRQLVDMITQEMARQFNQQTPGFAYIS